jgi:cellulose synthase/poly-beta-1,6-N-acetylglucosamine synthase-like glycosyltransferase
MGQRLVSADTIAEVVFWIGVAGVLYPYLGYPLVLMVLGKAAGAPAPSASLPRVTLLIPVHNEASRVAAKIVNTAALDYPADRLEVLFVSDGSTDGTAELIRAQAPPSMTVIELPQRGGKAAGLNAGLARATGEIVVFTDASIALQPEALRAIVRPFADARIGCVSGEDHIAETDGEGLYGRYELFLRRRESEVHSIVGASGSFYAQRRSLCMPFTDGMAPDFLSVLRTIEQGYRAISEPAAIGVMTSVKSAKQEFERKVRTLLRGMTALFAYPHLLNPFTYGVFALELWSHKVLRWTVPFFCMAAFAAPMLLLDRPFYLLAFAAQVLFYAGALGAFLWSGLRGLLLGRVALYFFSVNAAIVVAWYQYAAGVRQELWTPSRR